jgi:hypothetical protein
LRPYPLFLFPLTREGFGALKACVDRQVSPKVQALALTWAATSVLVNPDDFKQMLRGPVIAIGRCLQGEALIEAYWKNAAIPGQGIFIGEPMLRCFVRGCQSVDCARRYIFGRTRPTGAARLGAFDERKRQGPAAAGPVTMRPREIERPQLSPASCAAR